ncbi:hypothetical protein JYU12_00710 [bacterium AH-315-K03]|nr:hypothetical protein [bacterium AH-315-K03]
MGVTVELSEWFETGAPPHTFELTAVVNANLNPDAETILNSRLYGYCGLIIPYQLIGDKLPLSEGINDDEEKYLYEWI